MEKVSKNYYYIIRGFKAFNENLTCRGFQYEIGKTYEMAESPKVCERGFHFSRTIADCYDYFDMDEYYDMDENIRICEIEALGEIVGNNKLCTNKIKILNEVTTEWKKKGNTYSGCTGYCNTGNHNTGNHNTGYYNTGDANTGHCNTGYYNTGYWNASYYNTGDYNTGDCNTGDRNAGNHNAGNFNSGSCNTGDRNTGDYNIGHCNAGDWNAGNWNTGIFCTQKIPTIKIFDKESNWTIYDWLNSKASYILNTCPRSTTKFIDAMDMSEKEKQEHPEYNTIGGYLKVVNVEKSERKIWWNELREDERQEILNLPNFDKDIFFECTGIDID